MYDGTTSRRRVLTRCGATAVAVSLLAGCLSGDSDGDRAPNGDETETETERDDAPPAGDWPMYGADIGHTGYQPNATGPAGESVAIEPLFEVEHPGESGPAIADGTLYLCTRDEAVDAIDVESGDTEWRYELDGNGHWGPTVHDGVVYASHQHILYAIDAEEGETVWERDVFRSSFQGRVRSPRPTADGLLLRAGDELLRIDYEDGEPTTLAEFEGMSVHSSVPAIDDDGVYIASDETLYAFDSETGDELWRFDADDGERLGDYDPVVADGTVYIGPYAVEDGSERWRLEAGMPETPSPSVAGGLVYYNVGTTWMAVDAESGEPEWTTDINSRSEKPAVTDELVYVGGGLELRALEADTGDVRWRYYSDDVDISVTRPFVVSDGILYAIASNGVCYALRTD